MEFTNLWSVNLILSCRNWQTDNHEIEWSKVLAKQLKNSCRQKKLDQLEFNETQIWNYEIVVEFVFGFFSLVRFGRPKDQNLIYGWQIEIYEFETSCPNWEYELGVGTLSKPFMAS